MRAKLKISVCGGGPGIYFIVLLKTFPTYKGVDPPLAPPPTLTNKHVL